MIAFLHTHTMSRPMDKLRRALNGCAQPISLNGIPIYHNWSKGEDYSILGQPLNKSNWIRENIKNPDDYDAVWLMLADWVLFENGWFIADYTNKTLYYYKTQISYNRPDALDYIE